MCLRWSKRGLEITVRAVFAFSGEPLAIIKCRCSDTIAMLADAIALQSGDEDCCQYSVMLKGRVLEARSTLRQAGLVNGSTVSVVRRGRTSETGSFFVEVQSLDDLWQNDMGEWAPATLALRSEDLVFYATPECRDEDIVTFETSIVSGRLKRRFINSKGPQDKGFMSKFKNYLRVFVRETQSFEVIGVFPHEGRFGGIEIEPVPTQGSARDALGVQIRDMIDKLVAKHMPDCGNEEQANPFDDEVLGDDVSGLLSLRSHLVERLRANEAKPERPGVTGKLSI
mmetsp:Transcript_615/g.1407  ORF Transcript_615/g.1407 Transcript_615/m.1407 type:complete len:283 (-) Transcript_615:198-1046(-)